MKYSKQNESSTTGKITQVRMKSNLKTVPSIFILKNFSTSCSLEHIKLRCFTDLQLERK